MKHHHPGQSLSDQVCGVSSNHHSLCSSYERTSTIQDSKESTCYSTSPPQALVAGGLEYPTFSGKASRKARARLGGLSGPSSSRAQVRQSGWRRRRRRVSVELAIAGGRAFLACAQSGQGWVQNSMGGEFTGTEEPLLLVSGRGQHWWSGLWRMKKCTWNQEAARSTTFGTPLSIPLKSIYPES